MSDRKTLGSVEELRAKGQVLGKLGHIPVCVFLVEGEPRAIEDRCPHMGFPLHQGSVESGLLTCHWHHARFDLETGGTLDPWADDARVFPVVIEGTRVVVLAGEERDPLERLQARLVDGLEQGVDLVVAKAVVGLIDRGEAPETIVRSGVRFGVAYRDTGWGAGLTVLSAMANTLDKLAPEDRGLALVAVARDCQGRPPRFPLGGLGAGFHLARLDGWYRRFVATRSADSAERTLVSAVEAGASEQALIETMVGAVTDSVLLGFGHAIDFTTKAFEVLDRIGWEEARAVLPALVAETATGHRCEEDGEWRHPVDLVALLADRPSVAARSFARDGEGPDVGAVGWSLLDDDPAAVVSSLDRAIAAGATDEQIARAVAYAAALRIVRFHTQNDHGDWDVVHHAFTAANALHRAIVRGAGSEAVRGCYQLALRIHLDRFLNVPAARLPFAGRADATLADLARCFDEEGRVDDAGEIVVGYLDAGGDVAELVRALGSGLLREDAQFHWFQAFEATLSQLDAWPSGGPESRMLLVGFARFLAAHTPTRRELAQVVRIATRLNRGEVLYEEAAPSR